MYTKSLLELLLQAFTDCIAWSPTRSPAIYWVLFVFSGEGWKAYKEVFQDCHQVQYNIVYPIAKNVNF